ncbi:MAG: outer membrane protein assembly factor BamE [Lentisphaerota bacterium]
MKNLFPIFILAMLISGCTTPNITPNIPENAKLAQIKLGMSQEEVEHILGSPTDAQTKTTGNEWIPIYNEFPSDVNECTYYYKGQGTIAFTNKGSMTVLGSTSASSSMISLFVRRINYDPNEPGYANNH